jgi:hypothetical protein
MAREYAQVVVLYAAFSALPLPRYLSPAWYYYFVNFQLSNRQKKIMIKVKYLLKCPPTYFFWSSRRIAYYVISLNQIEKELIRIEQKRKENKWDWNTSIAMKRYNTIIRKKK